MKLVPGFSLIETIVSLIIITSVFAIITLSLSKVMESKNLNRSFELHLKIKNWAIETIANKDYIMAERTSGDISINRSFDYYRDDHSLLQMTITARDSKGTIETYNELIAIEDEKN